MWTDVTGAIQQLQPLTRFLLAAWLLTMISVPILQWVFGEQARTRAIALGVLLQAATVIAVLVRGWGWPATTRVAGIVISTGWLAEFAGAHTGFPFGHYRYTARLQPQVGNVPIVIPLAWLMMLPPAWAVSATLTGGHSGLPFIAIGALAFTAWDLFLDPQMVMWKLWIWEPPRSGGLRYFGVPWSNYLGWFLISALITWVALPYAGPWTGIQSPLLLIYGLTWALETFGQLVFWKLPGPAVVGGMCMGLFLVLARL